MKIKLFVLSLTFLATLKCYAQTDKYEDIRNYIITHCKPPKVVTNQCGWQLAMVKLVTNKQCRVINYSFLNQASDSLKLTFKPLLHYKFPAKLKMQNKTFVFAQTFYNLLDNCNKADFPDVQKVFEITYGCFTKQLRLNSKTIFDDVTFTSISNDERIIDKRP